MSLPPSEEPLPGNPDFVPKPDERGQMIPPPSVRLLSVADVRLPMEDGHQKWLDAFFLRCLECDDLIVSSDPAKPGTVPDTAQRRRYAESFREPASASPRLPGFTAATRPPRPGPRWYGAENFVLRYEQVESISPDQLRLVQLEVPSLDLLSQRLMAEQIPYERLRGLTPGMVHLQVNDPMGHVIQVFESNRLPL